MLYHACGCVVGGCCFFSFSNFFFFLYISYIKSRKDLEEAHPLLSLGAVSGYTDHQQVSVVTLQSAKRCGGAVPKLWLVGFLNAALKEKMC